MLFSTFPFAVFFIVYLTLHHLLPLSFRIPLIIVGSGFFYAWWKPDYIWLPVVLTVMAHVGAAWIGEDASHSSRRTRLAIVITALFVPLVFFKYFDFIYLNLAPLASGESRRLLNLALPLGVSFITFTLTAYIVDVFRGQYPREKSFFRLLSYVLFFPHLIAGPILRPHELLPQLGTWGRISFRSEYLFGFALISVGLFKKLVLADGIAPFVDEVYAANAAPNAWEYLIAIYGFSIQIYCDFSGYTDMAVGLALLLGIHIPGNFQVPYSASSLVEFWHRWHITLSTWLRDYLYIPLGGNRVPLARQMVNVMLTMLLGGLWHGANWTFVIWGALHGGALAIVHLLRHYQPNLKERLPGVVGWFITFHFVTIAWIFFRAPDFTTALRVFTGPFTAATDTSLFPLQRAAFPLIIMVTFMLTHALDTHARVREAVQTAPKAVILPSLLLLWVLAITVSQGSSAKFIYFDF